MDDEIFPWAPNVPSPFPSWVTTCSAQEDEGCPFTLFTPVPMVGAQAKKTVQGVLVHIRTEF
jgi:hypothetical protein